MRTAPLAFMAALVSCARPAPRLPFIDDDYPRARAEASARGLPLFVEITAPW